MFIGLVFVGFSFIFAGLKERILSILLFAIPTFYTTYLSPLIANSGVKIESGDTEILEQFSFGHNLYIKIDSIKILLLLIAIITLFLILIRMKRDFVK